MLRDVRKNVLITFLMITQYNKFFKSVKFIFLANFFRNRKSTLWSNKNLNKNTLIFNNKLKQENLYVSVY
jgi:hypothetical protein